MIIVALVTLLLSPWTGPSLPAATAAAAKYKITLSGAPQQNVELRAAGLPKGWIASFCTDKACAPFRYTLQLGSNGKGVIELAAIRTDDAAPARVRFTITADGADARTVDVTAKK